MKNMVKWLHAQRAGQKLATLILLGLAVHLVLPQITALKNSWQVLVSMRYWAVGLAFLAQFLSYLGNGYLLQRMLLIAGERLSLWRSTLIVFGSASIGLVAGGMLGSSAATYRWVSGSEHSAEGATLASLLIPLFNNLMLLLASILGLIYLLLAHDLSRSQIIGFGVTLLVLGVLIGVIVLAERYRQRSTGLLLATAAFFARIQRKPFDPTPVQQQAGDLFHALDQLWQGAWQKPALGAFMNMAFDMLTLALLFVAAGQPIGPGVLIAGYGLPQLLGKLAFFLPGGVGVVESSMAAIYNGLGVPSATTVVVVLGYRLISFWIPSLAGFLIAAYLTRTEGKLTDGPGAMLPNEHKN
jgi:uncharacterized membrane protein YbhN (UPF0104 family)